MMPTSSLSSVVERLLCYGSYCAVEVERSSMIVITVILVS